LKIEVSDENTQYLFMLKKIPAPPENFRSFLLEKAKKPSSTGFFYDIFDDNLNVSLGSPAL